MMLDTRIKIDFDKRRDVAFSSFIGVNPHAVIVHEEAADIIVYRDSDSNEPVGFTVMCVMESPHIWKKSLNDLGFGNLIDDFENATKL